MYHILLILCLLTNFVIGIATVQSLFSGRKFGNIIITEQLHPTYGYLPVMEYDFRINPYTTCSIWRATENMNVINRAPNVLRLHLNLIPGMTATHNRNGAKCQGSSPRGHLCKTNAGNRQMLHVNANLGMVDTVCDEYPFASTEEGGQSLYSNCVPASEQLNGRGGALAQATIVNAMRNYLIARKLYYQQNQPNSVFACERKFWVQTTNVDINACNNLYLPSSRAANNNLSNVDNRDTTKPFLG